MDTAAPCEPICGAIGSKSEAWLDSCSKSPIYTPSALPARDHCKNCTAQCKGVGNSPKGWHPSCTGNVIVAGQKMSSVNT